MLKRAEIERKGLGLSRRGKRSFKTDWHPKLCKSSSVKSGA